MLSKRSEHRKALRKLLPLIETQRNDLELHKSLDKFKNHTEVIEQQNKELEEYAKNTEDFKQQIENQKTEIENYKQQLVEKEGLIYELESQNKSQIEHQKTEIENYKKQLKKITEEKELFINYLINEIKNITIDQQNQNKSNYWQTFFGRKNKDQPKKREEYEREFKKSAEEQIRKQKLEPFFYQKKLEMTKNSTVVIDGLGNRLSEREQGDNDEREPPLKGINSVERKRKEVFDFIEFIRIKWNNPSSGTDIQKNICNWLYNNWHQFRYDPSEEEKEVSRKMFLDKFKLENTIGTIHFLLFQFSYCLIYFCFAISDYRIVYWSLDHSQQEAYSRLYNYLKRQRSLTQNLKFATKMEVDDKHSDTLIHTSNKDVFVENEKVITWIKNNFNLEDQNSPFLTYFHNILALYNFFVNFYDTSSIQ